MSARNRRSRPGRDGFEVGETYRNSTPAQAAVDASVRLIPGARTITGHEPSFWLRCKISSLLTRATSGELDTCPHPLNVPLIAPLWDTSASCARCAGRHRLVGAPDHTCDRCGAVVDRINGLLIAASPVLLVSLGLCADCAVKEVGE